MSSLFPKPVAFNVSHNATTYYILFRRDLPLGSIVLNYTVYINLTTVGDLLGIFLTITRTPILESIFGFTNFLRFRDYIFPFSHPSMYTETDGIASFEESIIIRGPVADSLFIGNIAIIDLELSAVVVGSGSSSTFEQYAILFAVIIKPSGESLILIHNC